MHRRSVDVPGLEHANPIPNASVVGNLLVTGGVSGTDPASGQVPDDPAAEVAQAFANLRAILDAAGTTLDAVAKVTVFVQDRAFRKHVNPVWTELFPDPASRPARHTLETSLSGVRIQLECLAVLDG